MANSLDAQYVALDETLKRADAARTRAEIGEALYGDDAYPYFEAQQAAFDALVEFVGVHNLTYTDLDPCGPVFDEHDNPVEYWAKPAWAESLTATARPRWNNVPTRKVK